MRRGRVRIVTGVLAFVLTVGAVAGTSVAAGTSSVGQAIDATELTMTTQTLAGQPLLIAAGGLLLGAGLGVVVASGLTYWYKNREIQGRLR